MSIRDYFLKNIINVATMGYNTKIIGSFSRNYKYPTDIDIYCVVEKNDYNQFMEKINVKHDNLIFTYVTLLVDLYKNIKIEVVNKNNFDNIDFTFIQKELTRLY